MGGANRGKNFEREISKELSLWLTTGVSADTVWYTKSSGGRATRRIRSKDQISKKYDHGDLGPDDSCVNYFFDIFNLELKSGYSPKKGKKYRALWSLLDLIDSKQKEPLFYQFWNQTVNDSKISKREPILIFRRNGKTPCIAMYNYIFEIFINSNKNKSVNFDSIIINQQHFLNLSITICSLQDFFQYTWGKINENFIKLKINRAILLHSLRKENNNEEHNSTRK